MNFSKFNQKPKTDINSNLFSDGFKLISLEVKDHPVLGSNKFNFIDDNHTPDKIYTSVIIGPNGTGKSYLLRFIIDRFRCINALSQGENAHYTDNRFVLKYSYRGSIFIFSNINSTKSLTSRKNKLTSTLWRDDKIVNFNEKKSLGLPDSIIAQAIMLTDKYPVLNKKEEEKFSMYKYLGVRNRPQQASTRYYVRKTVEYIVKEKDSIAFKDGLKSIINFLGADSSLKIVYYTSNTHKFYKEDITIQDIDDYFLAIQKKYQKLETKIPPFKLSVYLSLKNEDKLHSVVQFISNLVKSNKLEKARKNSAIKKLEYDILDEESYTKLRQEYNNIEKLRRLGLLNAPDIKLSKGEDYDLKHSSSGEYHFFSSMVGLLATVGKNSLILIDEPEISLHPNWQMKYLNFLRKIFEHPSYKTCHILIATHSHFLISDLQGDSSKIIGLKKEEGKLVTRDIDGVNTFGWSAEEVLYKIFDVATTRNHYIAMELNEILKEFSKKNRDKEMLKSKLKILNYLNEILSDKDPLKTVVNKLLSRIVSNEL